MAASASVAALAGGTMAGVGTAGGGAVAGAGTGTAGVGCSAGWSACARADRDAPRTRHQHPDKLEATSRRKYLRKPNEPALGSGVVRGTFIIGLSSGDEESARFILIW